MELLIQNTLYPYIRIICNYGGQGDVGVDKLHCLNLFSVTNKCYHIRLKGNIYMYVMRVYIFICVWLMNKGWVTRLLKLICTCKYINMISSRALCKKNNQAPQLNSRQKNISRVGGINMSKLGRKLDYVASLISSSLGCIALTYV